MTTMVFSWCHWKTISPSTSVRRSAARSDRLLSAHLFLTQYFFPVFLILHGGFTFCCATLTPGAFPAVGEVCLVRAILFSFAVHVSVAPFTWSHPIFEAGSDFGQIGPAVSKKYYNKTYYTILDHYTYLMRKPTSGDSVFGNINKRLIGQWVKPRSVAFIARGFADKRDAFILVRSIVFPKLAFCDSLA